MSATNVALAGKRGNICVGNNVSATMCPRLPGTSGGEIRDTKTLNFSRNIVSLQVFVNVSRFSPCVINLTRNKNCCGLKKVVAKSRARVYFEQQILVLLVVFHQTQNLSRNKFARARANQLISTLHFFNPQQMITAKIKFGILLCWLSMRFLMFSLVFFMLRIVFNVFSVMFVKTSLLFCCFCIRLFVSNYVCVVSVWCYAKPRCYYSCPYGVMRNVDAIIRVRMVLCETSMLLFVSVWCYAKRRCYYSCPYGVMRNVDAIIRVRMVLCETSMLLFVFRIMFVLIRVFRELDRYGLARVIN